MSSPSRPRLANSSAAALRRAASSSAEKCTDIWTSSLDQSDSTNYGCKSIREESKICAKRLSSDRGGQTLDHVFGDVAGDLGVLLEPPGRVLVPVLPERHVDPELVPGPDKYAPQFLVYPEEHLELVAVLGDFELVDEPEGVPDQELVVRRYADVDAALEQLVEQENVVLADGIEVLVGY